MARTKDIAEIIRRRLAADPDLAEAVRRERFNANIACEILAMREMAGLTQKQLADKIGTHQSVVARIEDADYAGHSLKLLHRIADALGRRVEIKFVGHAPSAPKAGAKGKSRKRTANR